ncbi:DUF5753 domain-containing protein [Actinoallomurus sp. NPDC050550]|uniref:DUF5753 domain-containing protein n=1 Tax=Actinoallomurus sp. NPDC050550 TaxID=3154937 RepID=UPI0033EB19BB
MERQAVLDRDRRLKFWAICDEAALHRLVGGASVMRGQLEHLVDVAELPNVTLQVIPFDVGAHPGMPGSFIVLNFADNPTVVYVDSMAGDLFIEEEADIRRYTAFYEHLRAVAAHPTASVRLIRKLGERLT